MLNAADARYPAHLRQHLGDTAPAQVSALGNLNLLALPKTALFAALADEVWFAHIASAGQMERLAKPVAV